MTRHSLRLRLLVASSASIALALAVAGLVLVALFGRHLERRIQEELAVQLGQLAGQVAFAADGTVSLAERPADPRFAVPLSGLYWQVGEDGAAGVRLRSRSLWDAVLALPDDPLPAGAVHRHVVPGPAGQSLIVQERRVVYPTPAGPRTLRIAVAADAASLAHARHEFAEDLVPALAVLAAVLSLAAWVQVGVGLRPLEAVRRGVGAVRARTRRRLEGRFPDEIRPLVAEVNDLLDAQERAIEHARHRAADLAHGLKTPLTVLLAGAARLRGRGEAELAGEIEAQVGAMRRHVDHELARARVAAGVAHGGHAAADLAAAVAGVVATLARTPAGGAIGWRVAVPDGCRVAVDPDDLVEMVGNLLENAAKWARTGVGVSAQATALADCGTVALRIADDGPGVPPEKLADLGRRGVRLDEATPGSGMGLAIVREIAGAYGGGLDIANGADGGLVATLVLPAEARGLLAPADRPATRPAGRA